MEKAAFHSFHGITSGSVIIMMTALRAKFVTGNPDLRARLLATGDAYLEERTANDSYWGSGSWRPNGPGANMLGRCLMAIRSELR